MSRALTLIVAAGVLPALSGCIAAAVPAGAAAIIARQNVRKNADRVPEAPSAATAVARPTASLPPTPAPVPAPGSVPVPVPVQALSSRPDAVPPGMQYLYGSGEAAAISLQSYFALDDFMIARSTDRAVGHDVPSVVLAPGATLANPKFMPCGKRPLAVVFDVDETALLNLGYESDDAKRGQPFDQARWERWEKTGIDQVVATPGAAAAVRVAQAIQIKIVFNSNRSAANGTETIIALDRAGLGRAVRGDTLWLPGDAGETSGKDARRWAISERYCVIAMIGDQLGDFSDLFNAPELTVATRRAATSVKAIETLWGHGWFMLPNPVYGSAIKGNVDDVFPRDKRWTDPAGVK